MSTSDNSLMMRRLRLMLAASALMVSASGCHLIQPPKVPEPMDPVPEMYHGDPVGELPIEVQDQMERMESRITILMGQMEQLQNQVDSRQRDLIHTRQQYEEARREIRLMREEIAFWGVSMGQLQERLSKRDEERLEMLDALSKRLGELASQ